MPRSDNDERPPFQRIVDDIRAKIERGELRDGDRLPSESELRSEYGVAKATAQRASMELVSEGLATSRVGSGLFVRAYQEIHRVTPDRLAHSWWGEGHAIQSADLGDRNLVVDAEVTIDVMAPAEAAEVLGLSPGDQVVQRDRRFTIDGRLVLVSRSYIPADLAMGTPISQRDTGPGGTYARLREAGHGPVRGTEIVRARLPRSVSPELRLPRGTRPCYIERRVTDAGGRCVEVNYMALDFDVYVLVYRFEM